MMRAAVYYNNRDIRIEDWPVPAIGPGEILMKVTASGICGSDILEWYRIRKAPLVLGHEVAGVAVEIGPGVESIRNGDRIVAAHHVPCNTCRYCLSGHHTACETLRRTNFDPGGFAEYLRLPAINVDRGVFVVPDEISDEAATFHEPVGCVLRSLRNSRLRPGQSVLVFGAGISGLLHILLARAAGVGKILAVEPSDFRRRKALDLGADAAVPCGEDLETELRRLNGGRLADLVFVCTGAERAHLQALESVERGGTVLFFALTDPGIKIPVSINDLFVRNDVTLTTSYGAAPVDSMTALELFGASRIDVRPLITHRLPLEQTGKGFEMMMRAGDSIKIIVNPQE